MKLLLLLSAAPLVFSFSPGTRVQSFCHRRSEINVSQAPSPSQWAGSNNHGSNEPQQNQETEESDSESLKANRWSKFAPDTDLSQDDFREQLKENMKADLERRRRENPNRGNQPAKSYLDSL